MHRYAPRIAGLLMLLLCAPAYGQERPTRPTRGIFGGGAPIDPEVDRERTRHESLMQMTLLAGYEDNLPPSTGVNPVAPQTSGYVGSSEAMLRYRVGHERRSFGVVGRGYVNTLPAERRPLRYFYGGEARVEANTVLGRRSGVSGSYSHRYDPLFELDPRGIRPPGDAAPDGPTSNPVNVLIQRPSWVSTATGVLTHDLSVRTRTEGSVELERRTFVEGAPFASRILVGSAAIDRAMSRSWNVRGEYRHSDGNFVELGGRPLTGNGQTMSISVRNESRLSSTRTLYWTAGSGLAHVDTRRSSATESFSYWTPVYFGSAGIDIGRSWNLIADYRRTASVIPGITAESFITNDVGLRLAGFLHPRLESAVSAGYVGGRAGQGFTGRYDAHTAEAQVRVHIARWWSAGVVFNRFAYQSNALEGGVLQDAVRTERNTVRVSLNWSLPLYGTFE